MLPVGSPELSLRVVCLLTMQVGVCVFCMRFFVDPSPWHSSHSPGTWEEFVLLQQRIFRCRKAAVWVCVCKSRPTVGWQKESHEADVAFCVPMLLSQPHLCGLQFASVCDYNIYECEVVCVKSVGLQGWQLSSRTACLCVCVVFCCCFFYILKIMIQVCTGAVLDI